MSPARAPLVAGRAGILVALLLAAACAPKLAPPPAVSAPKFPDFVFPAVIEEVDAVTAERQRAAWQWLQAGDLRTADRVFTAILKRKPQFTPAESGLGYVQLARHQPDDALARFAAALSHTPSYAPALAGRAQALLALGRDAEALSSLEAAAAADPSLDLGPRIEVLRFRGTQAKIAAARRAAEQGRLDEARTAYEQAIALSPDSAFLLRELAAVDERAGELPKAAEHLRKAIALDASDARAHVQLGDVLMTSGDSEAAVRAYQAAQALDATPEVAAKLDTARNRAELALLPPAYHAIAGLPEVTRGDVAAVLGVRLANLLEAARERPAVLLTDVRTHWAAPWILAVVRAGVMEPLPNHTFQPQQVVRRVDLARIASRVLALVAARRPASAAEWQSAPLQAPDVPPTHPTYPAVSQVVAARVLPLVDGTFAPARPVSGAELAAAADRLEALAGASGGRRGR
jgi:tetratricopeptide (TPR) repeat protein